MMSELERWDLSYTKGNVPKGITLIEGEDLSKIEINETP